MDWFNVTFFLQPRQYVISGFNQKETMGIESVVAMLSELKMKNQVFRKVGI
ncbi:hypothetical protein HCG49_13120 [Arenibacter sp. 6A1]|nr:hypothetical protein [Arenibacter sp. 6A1]